MSETCRGAVNFGLHVQLGVSLPGNVRSVSVEKHLSAPLGAVRCALPHFAQRNDFSSLTQQGLKPAVNFAAAAELRCLYFADHGNMTGKRKGRPHRIDSEGEKRAGVYRT